MKNLITTLTFSLILLNSSFPQTFDWVNTAKIFQSNSFSDTKVDIIGNAYSAGFIKDSISFDSVPVGITGKLYGNYDSYITKVDTLGEIKWIGQLNGSIESFDIDNAGNMYLFFFYLDTIDADPGPGVYLLPKNSSPGNPLSNGVAKIDTQGNLVWATSITARGISDAIISVSNDGDLFLVITQSGKVDLDPSPTSVYSPSLLSKNSIFKWNTDGNFMWGGGLGGFNTTNIIFNSLEVKLNRIILTGIFQGTLDFNIDTNVTNNRTSANFSNLFILAYDTSGIFQWVHDFPKQNNAEIIGSYLDDESNIYLSGRFRNPMDFNFGAGQAILTPVNGDNIFILKMDSAGSFTWVKQITSISPFPQIFSVNIHGSNTDSFYITLILNGALDLTPSNPATNIINSNGIFQNYTLRYKLNGTYNDSWSIGLGGSILVEKLFVSRRNDLTYTGKFIDSVDFDPTQLNQFRFGAVLSLYILRLNQCFETNSQILAQSCGNFLSPSGHFIWNTSGAFLDTITNHMGCDSVIDVNLSVTNTDTTLFLLGTSLASNEFSATYQWLDCNSNYAAIPNQMAQLFTPIQNGNYALEITKNGCVDTTACFVYNLVGNQEFSLENSIQIFPNPSDGQFTLLMSSSYDRLTITDISGRIVWSQDESSHLNTSIDLSFCKNGIYFMEIISEGERVVKKLLKI